jgi:ankyrin repeat protein
MFYAALTGKVRVLNYMVENGLDIHETDIYNQTPLFYAARDNRLDFVKRLI